MWNRIHTILKHIWENPITQFIFIAFLEDITALFHRKTKNKYKQYKKNKKNACSQDYSVGTDEPCNEIEPDDKSSDAKSVNVEQQKVIKKTVRKKVVPKLEETKPTKSKRTTTRKRSTNTEKPTVKKTRSSKTSTETKK